MPNMISLRKFRLSTTTGHMISFNSNEPVYVPDEAVSAAMAAGCAPVNGADQVFFDDVQRSRVEFSGDLRKSILHFAIGTLVKENDPRKFDGSGLPRLDVLSKRLGFEVFKDERRVAHQTYMAVLKNGEHVVLHKDAESVLAVIDAEGKAELLLLANKHGVEAEQAAGLTTKDLRKMLLARFSGLTSA